MPKLRFPGSQFLKKRTVIFFKKFLFILGSLLILTAIITAEILFFEHLKQKRLASLTHEQRIAYENETIPLEFVATEAASPKPSAKPRPFDPFANDPVLKDAEWGKAIQVTETGYRMKIQQDDRMTTAKELFEALNAYRNTKGKSTLTWDNKLGEYASERANFICKNGSDSHAGFRHYVENEDGFNKLGFYRVGENMSTYYKMTGVHLIEFIYAGDKPHDDNQLGDWSHVGTGVADTCTALIFGNEKM